MKNKFIIISLLSHILPFTSQASHIPSLLNEESYNQLRAGTHPTLELVEGTVAGLRHGEPGFTWDKNVTLERLLFMKPGVPVEEEKLLYAEARSPQNNFIMFSYKDKKQISPIPEILTKEIYNQLVAGTHPAIVSQGAISQMFHGHAGRFHWDRATEENLIMKRRLFLKPGIPLPEGKLVYEATTRTDTLISLDYKTR